MLATINKRHVNIEIYLYEKKIQNDCIFWFNDNTKEFSET
jgi:hypothetical protein